MCGDGGCASYIILAKTHAEILSAAELRVFVAVAAAAAPSPPLRLVQVELSVRSDAFI